MSSDGNKTTQQLEQFGYKQELSRSVSTIDLIVYGLIFMVPIAPWAIYGEVYNLSKGMVPLVYVIGLVAMIFTALSYGQMAKAFPLAGGVFSYVGRGTNPRIGFFAGWLMLLDYLLVPTLLYVIAAESMVGIFPGTPRWLWGLVFVAINVAVNLAGVTSLKRMNRLFLAMELIFVFLFLFLGIKALMGHELPGAHWSIEPLLTPEYVTPALMASALSVAVLSFLGFDGISTLAEESTEGSKGPARAMIIGLFIVATLFIAQTWVASSLSGSFVEVPEDRVGNYFFDIVGAIAGTGVMKAFFLCNVLAVGIANSMAAQAATSRLLFSMARDGHLPRFLRHINHKKVPSNSILFVGAISALLVLVFAGQIATMSSMVNFGALASFAMLHLAVLYYYGYKKRSRSVFHTLFPLLGFVIVGFVLINAGAEAHIAGGLWFCVGLIAFVINSRRGVDFSLPEELGHSA